MTSKPTRRALALGLIAALPAVLCPAHATAARDPILDLIEAHAAAVRAEQRAVAASNAARRAGSPDAPVLRQERQRRRSERRAARRALRSATPAGAAGYEALSAHYRAIVPAPDPDDVASLLRADLDAVRDRMMVRLAVAGSPALPAERARP